MRFLKPYILAMLPAIATFSFLCAPCPARGSTPLEAVLSSNSEQAAADEPVFLHYLVENNNAQDVIIPAAFFTPAPIGQTGLSFSVISPGGDILDNSCTGNSGDSTALLTMAPGEFHGRKSIPINQCYNMSAPGTYRISAAFTSMGNNAGTWSGVLSSNQITVKIREGQMQKISRDAGMLLNSWKDNYNITTSQAYKQRIASMGLSAVPAIALMLTQSDSYSFTSDLLDLLSMLPSSEAGDAILKFVATAPTRKFRSNMPEGFSAGKMLVGEAFQSMSRMTNEDLALQRRIFPDATTEELWKMWWAENREKFPGIESSRNIMK